MRDNTRRLNDNRLRRSSAIWMMTRAGFGWQLRGGDPSRGWGDRGEGCEVTGVRRWYSRGQGPVRPGSPQWPPRVAAFHSVRPKRWWTIENCSLFTFPSVPRPTLVIFSQTKPQFSWVFWDFFNRLWSALLASDPQLFCSALQEISSRFFTCVCERNRCFTLLFKDLRGPFRVVFYLFIFWSSRSSTLFTQSLLQCLTIWTSFLNIGKFLAHLIFHIRCAIAVES